ncbi:hypothetical protein [Agarivorans sp. Alg241-V36]|uniref:hypothetical protein n=1 Tax=Agarivorans sp. Alg241-V36 TaxID=2305992 RepID=UPI0013D0681C|nr:hypothetical protein [Agarivorans sp. Alg241-V36]
MKNFSLCLITLSFSLVGNTAALEVFDSKVELQANCNLVVETDGITKTIEPAFSQEGQCSIMTHGKTNVPKTLYVNGMYVFFIENSLKSDSACKAQATSFGIDKQNNLYITDYIKSFSRCNLALEAKSFEIFSAKMKAN